MINAAKIPVLILKIKGRAAGFLLILCACLSACGGAKVLEEPIPMEELGPLAATGNEQLEVVLDWVIVRDGPGTWSRDAYWDEYLLRVANLSDAELSITLVEVVDALALLDNALVEQYLHVLVLNLVMRLHTI